MPISGFVISYNRADMLATCLRSLRFVDELVVVDKSSTDDSRRIAWRYADRVIKVPWSPTVEETRAFALAQCRHDWIIFLDDDEMLMPAAIEYLSAPRSAEDAPAVALPMRHWILGAFDADAYYWPEHHIRFFRRGALTFHPIVHGGTELLTDRIERIPPESPICIEHLPHADAHQWIERTNRYTSQPARVRAEPEAGDLIDFAHRRIEHWFSRSHTADRDGYVAAMAVLRAIYDMVDRVKAWEDERGLDGAAVFRARCSELNSAYDALEARLGIATGARANRFTGLLRRLRRLLGVC
jgi:glycosyltransferase involved in cell wall biosynthesis